MTARKESSTDAPSRPRQRRLAAGAAAFALALGLVGAPASRADTGEQNGLPDPLVFLRDIDSGILQEIRYAGPDNFTGRPVPGYGAAECVLLREVAEALSRVQQDLLTRKLSLKVYDCYRPRRAVRAFAAWVKEPGAGPDPLLERFHPNVERRRLIDLGYIAGVSRHSRGDTVDLTLVALPARRAAPFDRNAKYGACTGPAKARAPDDSIDMGTGFDCFDPLSHTDAGAIAAHQQRWRKRLVDAMAREGFVNYEKEWWHFTFGDRPAPRSFDVPIPPRRR
jgi:D-alanyl-D-alanine dipeptidase